MEDYNYLLKCSVIEQLNNKTQFLTNVSVSVPSEVTKTAGYGAFMGIIIAVIANGFLDQKFRAILSGPSLKFKESNFNAKILFKTIVLSGLVLVLPLLIVLVLLACVYKLLCSVVIKNKDKHFVGFLDSFDVFWSLEDDTAKSVINVVGVIESDSPDSIVDNIKEKLKNIFPNEATDKIFFRRNEDFGFYYWRRYSSVDMNEYVEVVELPNKSNASDMEDLEIMMTEISNQSLPYNDEGLFKILITKQRIGNYDKERGEYGIIFRIHHSVGDGVALIEFLCKTLADNKNDCPVNMFSNPLTYNVKKSNSPNNLMEMIKKLLQMPICFVDGVLRKPDENSLHGPRLLDKRIYKWTESDENLLMMVKDIKDNVDKMKFTDVLATALSSGLRNFFSQTMTCIPEDVAVVLPVRFPKTCSIESDLKMENDFSVTILDLPVKGAEIIQDRCEALRNSADPLTNYYLLKLLNSVLPKQILQPMLCSSQATMVFSNMPGPKRLSICGGILKKLVFFVPQRGNTGLLQPLSKPKVSSILQSVKDPFSIELSFKMLGVGVTALCYDGILRFGAVADMALVSEPAHLALILDGMVEEIKRLHEKYVK